EEWAIRDKTVISRPVAEQFWTVRSARTKGESPLLSSKTNAFGETMFRLLLPRPMSILRIALPILLAAISCPAAPLPKERIRESEQRQEQIGAEAKQLVGALDVM